MFLKVLFWLSILIVCYTYAGYAILLWLIVKIKEIVKGKPIKFVAEDLPDVTLLVTAYNEKNCLAEKVKNSQKLE